MNDVLLPAASSFAESVDHSFLWILWLAEFLLVLLLGSLVFLGFRALRTSADESVPDAGEGVEGRVRWATVSAAALVTVLYVHGFQVHADQTVAPRDSEPILVRPEGVGFVFHYRTGPETTELHLPLGRPVELRFQGDVEPYSFALPEFRLQADVLTGEARSVWVEPTVAGEFVARSLLRPTLTEVARSADVLVHAEGEYDTWLQEQSGPPLDLPPVELGQRSFAMRGCTQCHTVDGSKLTGPSFFGFYSREHRLVDGTVVEPTDDYVKESLLDPSAKVVEGFEPVMPSFRGRLHDLEIAGLIAYFHTLE